LGIKEDMTQDEIIEMARKAGSLIEIAQEKDLLWLAAFAKLVAEHEREACAKVCDNRVTAYQYATDVWAQEHIDEARHLAKAIRARGQA
jgi:hypothetical protein